MLWTIDTASDEPLFAQIAARVRAAVSAGELREGDRLPPARTLADSLDVNVHTVLHAYQDLRDEGLVDLRRGRGAVVRAHPEYVALAAPLAALVDAARRAGVSPATTASLLHAAFAQPTPED
ncbi:GntR family transcriptional regulator [Cellulomonas persica]|nr:GntR family transcriptional regulator [Cellulomonas persica]